MKALEILGLNVSYQTDRGTVRALRDVNLAVGPGRTLGIVGESGSGKSTLVSAIIRLLDANADVESGSVQLSGRDLLELDSSEMRLLRGDEVSMVFQDPMTSLNPVLTIGWQMTEIQYRDSVSKAEKKARAIRFLDRVGLQDPERQFDRYPHQLSGGMRQRVAIAMALMMKPSLLIADEPTTALDATLEVEILARLRKLQQEEGCAILFISHHLGAVSELCDDVVVMLDGEVVEAGATREVFSNPEHPYTRMLLASDPAHSDTEYRTRTKQERQPALSVQDLRVRYAVDVVKGVSFDVQAGETLAVVGESGSGKTSLIKAICGLAPVTAGSVEARGEVAMMFQDPVGSLSPRMTVRKLVAEPFLVGAQTVDNPDAEALKLLRRVGLDASFADRYPHQLSGGQARRVGLARALAQRPDILLTDEPTAGLDVSIQGEMLELMTEVQQELGLAIVIVTHNLNIIRQIADRMAIMYKGEFVEQGPCSEVCDSPNHAYTARLLAANLTMKTD